MRRHRGLFQVKFPSIWLLLLLFVWPEAAKCAEEFRSFHVPRVPVPGSCHRHAEPPRRNHGQGSPCPTRRRSSQGLRPSLHEAVARAGVRDCGGALIRDGVDATLGLRRWVSPRLGTRCDGNGNHTCSVKASATPAVVSRRWERYQDGHAGRKTADRPAPDSWKRAVRLQGRGGSGRQPIA